jgi:hypothetical protein
MLPISFCLDCTQAMLTIFRCRNFCLPFLFNNQPDALIVRIYSVIKLYMFRASSLPIIRSFLVYIRHWQVSCRFWWPLLSRVILKQLIIMGILLRIKYRFFIWFMHPEDEETPVPRSANNSPNITVTSLTERKFRPLCDEPDYRKYFAISLNAVTAQKELRIFTVNCR